MNKLEQAKEKIRLIKACENYNENFVLSVGVSEIDILEHAVEIGQVYKELYNLLDNCKYLNRFSMSFDTKLTSEILKLKERLRVLNNEKN